MQFFAATFEQLTAYRELVRSQQEGVTPVSFTGVSQIHKAHLLTALCRENAPVLVVTAEETEARRLCDDINAMLDETAAWMFPAKEVVLTPVEGITTAYEHARIAALTALRTGQCRALRHFCSRPFHRNSWTTPRFCCAGTARQIWVNSSAGSLPAAMSVGRAFPDRDSFPSGAISWMCSRYS